MNKYISLLVFGLLCFVNTSEAQNLIFDKGKGTYKAMQVGYTVVKLLEEKKLVEVLNLYSERNSPNKKEVEKNIQLINLLNPHRETLPQSFYDEGEDGTIYYERNYCITTGSEVKYNLQLHINLVQNGDQYLIDNIEFRKGNKVQNRDEEIEQIENVNEGGRPAPPPPPPIK